MRRTGAEMHTAVLILTALDERWGGSAERKGSDLTQTGLSEGMLYDPVYHALSGGHAGSFEVPDHPAGNLQTCSR